MNSDCSGLGDQIVRRRLCPSNSLTSFSYRGLGSGQVLFVLWGTCVADAKSCIVHGAGIGVFTFVVYAGYALAFQFGTTPINEGYENAGQVVNANLAIKIGSFSLAMMAPELQAATQGRGAAAKHHRAHSRY